MGLFSKDQDAVNEHHAAKADLEDTAKQHGPNSQEFENANQRVAEAEKHVSWFRR